MKRCPQCEFTFDDHQHFCDFDGTELSAILERRPSSQNLSAPHAILPSVVLRFLRSNFSLAVLALAGIVLSALLVGYYSATEAESKGDTGGSVAALPPPSQDCGEFGPRGSGLRDDFGSFRSDSGSDQDAGYRHQEAARDQSRQGFFFTGFFSSGAAVSGFPLKDAISFTHPQTGGDQAKVRGT